jgi:hypothetical protein
LTTPPTLVCAPSADQLFFDSSGTLWMLSVAQGTLSARSFSNDHAAARAQRVAAALSPASDQLVTSAQPG